jgi:hypothetical protein
VSDNQHKYIDWSPKEIGDVFILPIVLYFANYICI